MLFFSRRRHVLAVAHSNDFKLDELRVKLKTIKKAALQGDADAQYVLGETKCFRSILFSF